MRRALGLLVLLSAAACGSASSRSVMGPDGKSWWYITCRRGHDHCLDEAAELCPGGYVVGTAEEHDGPSMVVANGLGGANVYTQRRGSMMIQCRGRTAAEPEKDPLMMSNAELGAYVWRKGHEEPGDGGAGDTLFDR